MAGHLKDFFQRDHWHVVAAHPHQRRALRHRADGALFHLKGLDHRGQRQEVDLVSHPHRHAVHDGQRQRQAHRDLHAMAFARVHLDRPVQRRNVAPHHVQTDTAPRHVGHHLGSREAGLKDQHPHLGVAHLVGRLHAALARLAQQLVTRQAAPVVAHLNHYGAALVRRRQGDGAVLGLAFGQPLFGHFNAMVATVAHQVRERVGDLFHQPLVQLGGFAPRHQLDPFAELTGQVAQHARKAAEDDRHRNHAHRHHRLLQVARVALQIGQTGQQLLVHSRVQVLAVLRQHGLRDHQFAHQVDQLVHLADRHTQGAGLHRHRACGTHWNGSSFGQYGFTGGQARQVRFMPWSQSLRRVALLRRSRRSRKETIRGRPVCNFSRKGNGNCSGNGRDQPAVQSSRSCSMIFSDLDLFLGHMECKQVMQVSVGRSGLHGKHARVPVAAGQVVYRAQPRNVPEQFLDGIGLLQLRHGTDANVQLARARTGLDAGHLWPGHGKRRCRQNMGRSSRR